MFHPVASAASGERRAPHGARGLKCFPIFLIIIGVLSGSTRSPWIEIVPLVVGGVAAVSGSTRSPWIEIVRQILGSFGVHSRAPHGARGLKYVRRSVTQKLKGSGSTRSPWIEIQNIRGRFQSRQVGLHTEPVD